MIHQHQHAFGDTPATLGSRARDAVPANAGRRSRKRRHSPSGLHPLAVVLLASLWLGVVCNIYLWQELTHLPGVAQSHRLALGLGLGLFSCAAVAAVLSVLAWSVVLKLAVVALLLIAGPSTYFMLTYHIAIDSAMINNILLTDPLEALDFFSWRLVMMVSLLSITPAWWLLNRPIYFAPLLHQTLANAITLVVSCLIAAGVAWWMYADFSPILNSHATLRFMVNPLNTLIAGGEWVYQRATRAGVVPQDVGMDAKLGPSYAGTTKPPLLVLVIGETARAENFSLNGYARETNPELTREDVVSFRQVRSCGTSTAASLPCMFSHLGREAFEARTENQENLLDVLQHAGLAILWIDNQSGCVGVCDRVSRVNTSRHSVDQLCDTGECLDEIMLWGLDERLKALPAQKRDKGVVVVMHMKGSRGPAYSKHSPRSTKTFMTECANNLLQGCEKEQLVNAYDNTIVYTDHVLHGAVQWLKEQGTRYSTSMIYISDHGESLGENNLYLHGAPYASAPDAQKHVPLITWLSPQQQQRSHTSSACLRKRVNQPLTHDNLFHSVIGLMDIKTGLYQRDLDWFAPCVGK